MLEDGTPGPNWPPMIDTFERTLDSASAFGAALNGLTIVWFQGEADVYPQHYPLYEARLRQLVAALKARASSQWPGLPEPAFSLALPYDNEAQYQVAIGEVREAISRVAADTPRVCAFETKDIPRVDTVHIRNLPGIGSPEQFIVANRALACARKAANRC